MLFLINLYSINRMRTSRYTIFGLIQTPKMINRHDDSFIDCLIAYLP
jgi:hypothetical protein